LLGGAVVPQLGEPVVHLEHAGVVWPDPDLHVGPPLVPKVSVVQPRMTCSGAGACTGMTDRGGGCVSWASQAPVLPAGHPRSCRAIIRRPGERGLPSASAWFAPVGVHHHCACPPLFKRPGSPSLGLSIHGPDSALQLDIRPINI